MSLQLLAIFVPFVPHFLVDGVRSWMGWLMIFLVLIIALLPVVVVSLFLNAEQTGASTTFEALLFTEIALAAFYVVLWVVTIVFAFTRWPKLARRP